MEDDTGCRVDPVIKLAEIGQFADATRDQLLRLTKLISQIASFPSFPNIPKISQFFPVSQKFWEMGKDLGKIRRKSVCSRNYPKLEVGDNVGVPVINKVHKGYKDSFSMEIHKVEDVNRGLYTVDGSLHPRKDLQLVKDNIYKHLPKPRHNKKNVICRIKLVNHSIIQK